MLDSEVEQGSIQTLTPSSSVKNILCMQLWQDFYYGQVYGKYIWEDPAKCANSSRLPGLSKYYFQYCDCYIREA